MSMKRLDSRYYTSIEKAIGPVSRWAKGSLGERYDLAAEAEEVLYGVRHGDRDVWARRKDNGTLLFGRRYAGRHFYMGSGGRYLGLTRESVPRSQPATRHHMIYRSKKAA